MSYASEDVSFVSWITEARGLKPIKQQKNEDDRAKALNDQRISLDRDTEELVYKFGGFGFGGSMG